jgi:hypothetical protein
VYGKLGCVPSRKACNEKYCMILFMLYEWTCLLFLHVAHLDFVSNVLCCHVFQVRSVKEHRIIWSGANK